MKRLPCRRTIGVCPLCVTLTWVDINKTNIFRPSSRRKLETSTASASVIVWEKKGKTCSRSTHDQRRTFDWLGAATCLDESETFVAANESAQFKKERTFYNGGVNWLISIYVVFYAASTIMLIYFIPAIVFVSYRLWFMFVSYHLRYSVVSLSLRSFFCCFISSANCFRFPWSAMSAHQRLTPGDTHHRADDERNSTSIANLILMNPDI